jgi:hypothetical protein
MAHVLGMTVLPQLAGLVLMLGIGVGLAQPARQWVVSQFEIRHP